ncbi:MAG: acyl-CoA desaturase [Bacteroidia bacterium]|nr:acyl-CoA desaturase [Bacteroidia bacterium]
MIYQPVKFTSQRTDEFLRNLRQRVNEYFDEHQISTYGNHEMVLKTIAMLAMLFIPYGLIVSGLLSNGWLLLLCWLVMGIANAGIGMSVTHDANHGSYSKNQAVNRALGHMINFLGGFTANWKIQHNRLHHSFTNIDGHDEDIAPGPVLRLHPEQPLLKHHRAQHIYAWFVYSLMTIFWVTGKDFKQLNRYKNNGLLGKRPGKYQDLLTKLIGTKVMYFGYIMVIPLLFSAAPWYMTVGFFLLMHLVTGFILAAVFQLAHVMPSSEFPVANPEGEMDTHWAVHQLETTTNFSQKSKIFSWYVGGLNFQIEHHLFPNICHIHYKKLSKIVAETAKEHGLPYNVQGNFIDALRKHGQILKSLGRQAAL